VLKHIHEQRFDEAIAGLEPSNLFIGENPVQQLHLALETLRQSAPEKAQGLCQKLIDHLAAESAWGQPNAA